MKYLQGAVASIFLVLFAAVWLYLAYRLATFAPTASVPTLPVPAAQVNMAGVLATGVSAGTAAVLGVKVNQSSGQSVAVQVGKAFTSSTLLMVGIGVYVFVGIVVGVVYFLKSAAAPDLIGSFALGVLGWSGAAFTAVFKGTESPG